MADFCEHAAEHAQRALHVSIWHMQVQICKMMTPPDNIEQRYCLDCHVLIPPKRIQAVPGAIRCVKCQEIYERTHKERIFDE